MVILKADAHLIDEEVLARGPTLYRAKLRRVRRLAPPVVIFCVFPSSGAFRSTSSAARYDEQGFHRRVARDRSPTNNLSDRDDLHDQADVAVTSDRSVKLKAEFCERDLPAIDTRSNAQIDGTISARAVKIVKMKTWCARQTSNTLPLMLNKTEVAPSVAAANTRVER